MKALLYHCKKYSIKIESLATRPPTVLPEKIKEKEQSCTNCVAIFITFENQDDIPNASLNLVSEIKKMCMEVSEKNVVVVPFAHLSNNLAPSTKALEGMDLIESLLTEAYHVKRAHFGSHKELLLDVYGHPGNVRYREF